MRFLSAGKIYRKFRIKDKKTILNPRNIRTFVTQYNVDYHKVGKYYLIDYDDFIKKINPRKINKEYPCPIIRTIQSATREFNKRHKLQISYHMIERCLEIYKNDISIIKTEKKYLINYNELEEKLIQMLEDNFKIVD